MSTLTEAEIVVARAQIAKAQLRRDKNVAANQAKWAHANERIAHWKGEAEKQEALIAKHEKDCNTKVGELELVIDKLEAKLATSEA